MTARILTICLAALWTASGCGSMREGGQAKYEASLREYRAAATSARAGEAAPEGELSLAKCLEMAVRSSRALEQARLAVEIAGERVVAANSFFLPRVDVSAGYRYMFRTPTRSTDALLGDDVYGHLLSGDIALVVPIHDFGRSGARFRKAEIFRLSEMAAQERTRQQAVYEATRAYFDVLYSRHLQRVAAESAAQALAHRDRTADFFAEQMIDRKDLLQAEVRLAQAKQFQFQAERAVENACSVLRRMIGVGEECALVLADMLDAGEPEPFPALADCRGKAVRERPELYRLSQQIRMGEAELEEAEATLYPRIYAVGSYSYLGADLDFRREDSSEEGDDSLKLDNHSFMGGVMIDVNLFSGGRTGAEIAEAKCRIEQAKSAYRDNVDRVELQVEAAHRALAEAKNQLTVSAASTEQARENLRILEDRYREQMLPATEVLDGQVLLTRTEIERLQALYACKVARATLDWAMGSSPEERR